MIPQQELALGIGVPQLIRFVSGLRISGSLEHDDGCDRGGPPGRGDPALQGWCFWQGWGCLRTFGSGALGSSERPTERAVGSGGESLHSTLLVAIEDLVADFAGDPELPAEFRHGFAG